ncbi:pyruvyltransferase [Butyrivibrio sp. YAB3001]|nr:pyruvyltransferase [Butyrivibrio sp. YAB3001]
MITSIKQFGKRILIKSEYYRNNHSIECIPLKKNRVNLEYWNYTKNLGDCLSPIIVDWMLKKRDIRSDKKLNCTKHLYAVGSVIGMGQYFDATIWGAGLHTQAAIENVFKECKYRKYDIRAVRGPNTAEIMRKAGYYCPNVYGDPAVLMPLLYSPQNICKQYKASIIHHYSVKKFETKDLHEISIRTGDYKYFIDEICKSELVISSSLHGIILAECYGTPAIFFNEGLDEEIFKFQDWYYSTGRYDIRYATKIEDISNFVPMELPDLHNMQENLLRSFPYDLWLGKK